ncbi:hypothetical protein HBI33_099890 [Parastagonospora nodorum]|nr:hypothetical protein HBI33_099890 [Parastagonospora nodorum]
MSVSFLHSFHDKFKHVEHIDAKSFCLGAETAIAEEAGHKLSRKRCVILLTTSTLSEFECLEIVSYDSADGRVRWIEVAPIVARVKTPQSKQASSVHDFFDGIHDESSHVQD